MESLFSFPHSRIAGRDVRGHVVSSLRMQIQYFARTKEYFRTRNRKEYVLTANKCKHRKENVILLNITGRNFTTIKSRGTRLSYSLHASQRWTETPACRNRTLSTFLEKFHFYLAKTVMKTHLLTPHKLVSELEGNQSNISQLSRSIQGTIHTRKTDHKVQTSL